MNDMERQSLKACNSSAASKKRKMDAIVGGSLAPDTDLGEYGESLSMRGDFGDDDAQTASNCKKGFMRLPDVIETLAREGRVLRWDAENNCTPADHRPRRYEVLDGSAFEAAFNELRYTRGGKANSHRPFSRMHTHFVLVRGEKWAGTGSAFTPKQQPVKEEVQTMQYSASQVSLTLRNSSSPEGFQCSLQHFMDVTGAGELYVNAMANQFQGVNSPSSGDSSVGDDVRTVSPHPQHHLLSLGATDTLLNTQDISSIVGTIWSADCRGDQAYFFKRAHGVAAFTNGSIVSLVNGELIHDTSLTDVGLYMVVSDNNAKWKGEPIPSPEEEKKGHWCAFLGQVPVQVEGVVQCGDYIGPKANGSGIGMVCQMGEKPVIGIALDGKATEELGIVKTLCFVGLNAMTKKGDTYKELFQRAIEVRRSVDKIKLNVQAVQKNMETLHSTMGMTDHQMTSLEQRVSRMENSLLGVGAAAVGGQGATLACSGGVASVAMNPAELPQEESGWRMAGYIPRGIAVSMQPWWQRYRLVLGVVVGVCMSVMASAITVQFVHHEKEHKEYGWTAASTAPLTNDAYNCRSSSSSSTVPSSSPSPAASSPALPAGPSPYIPPPPHKSIGGDDDHDSPDRTPAPPPAPAPQQVSPGAGSNGATPPSSSSADVSRPPPMSDPIVVPPDRHRSSNLGRIQQAQASLRGALTSWDMPILAWGGK